ncbi:MAG: transketolase [Verrucomicrobiota bacterium]|nr:transketolase [Verrucomicrobiota bacterium]
MDKVLLGQAAAQARGLAIDAVHACSSGHLGLPLGAAEIGAVLFSDTLRFNPSVPRWINRDRFVLSAGHGSMFIYTWLHLAGYDLSLDEVKAFRKHHSKTPGHPEFGETDGVECTTGPLGQGVGNAVGMAVSAKMAAARFNTQEHQILDYKVVALAGDGCLQEGVAAEAASFAGHFGLDNLILIYDSNDVTLDAMASATQSEDTALRFTACGFEVQTIDGHDFDSIANALAHAYAAKSGKPQLIVAKTIIGKGIAEVAGTAKAHGEGGAKFSDSARKSLGLPEEHFYVSPEVRAHFAKLKSEREDAYAKWQLTYAAWKSANPDKAALLEPAVNGVRPEANALLAKIPAFPADAKIATRKAGADVLQPIGKELPLLVSGSADLHGSTLNYIAGAGDFTKATPAGRNIRFGIREHAMGAILNGFGYDGLFIASGATFLMFSDYMRPSIRLAGLAKLPVFYIFTHDSVGVGEDGPTHQPVEVTSSLRLIPNLDVIRPGDPEETAGAFAAAVSHTDGPTALILSRQAIPTLNEIPVDVRREGTLKGGYIAKKETSELETIILATGTELQHALAAAKQLGSGVRVVSLPSFERFDRQSDEYRENVLPKNVRKRVAIEAGVTDVWYKYVGLGGKVIGIDCFGFSAPGDTVMKELGITAANVVAAVNALNLVCPACARRTGE